MCKVSNLAVMAPAGKDEVTSTEAAAILGIARPTILLIPRDKLPYRQLEGGAKRAGRRYYKRADVERLAARQRGEQ